MATEWYLMGNLPVYNSGFEQEEFDAYATGSFSELLSTSPIAKTIVIINHDLTVISENKVVVLNNVADSTLKSIERHVLTAMGLLQCGDYIKFESKVWLVTSLVGNNGIYEKAIMQLCTYSVPFQSQDGTILSYPCIDETNSSVGIDSNNTMTVPNSIHTIKLPFDANTSSLMVDRRLYISKNMNNPRSFKITKINDTEFNYGDKGLIVFTLEETQNEENNDRPDLGICNYIEPNTTPTPSPTGYVMNISASGDLIIGGTQRRFTPKLVDSNGVEQSFVGIWSFEYYGVPTNDITITYNGNDCLIKVAEDYDIIDSKLVLTCTTDDGLYNAKYTTIITA